ncbi:MAG: HNH endonuclease [Nevskia sp.]|jgi:hypothetical protein|nr:HNH endonuclease [Nevskia sp.]MCK9385538.1 HNH endonuclease [Nevskia sp.]
MSIYQIKIFWDEEEELIFFDSERPLTPGEMISTTASWEGYPEATRYSAEVVEYQYHAVNGRYTIRLRYDRNSNEGQARDNHLWGQATINLDTVEKTASAEWLSEHGQNDPTNGHAEAELIPLPLFEELGTQWVERRRRRQQQFKNQLLDFGACCALSGDCTLSALEAAHIIPVNQNGAFNAANGLLLRADLHKMYDCGDLKIGVDGTASIPLDAKVSAYYRSNVNNWRLNDAQQTRVLANLRLRNQ